MKFLSDSVQQALAPKQSIIGLLKQRLGGYEKARSPKTVHASDVTKEDFCPRRVALYILTGTEPSDQYIPTALRTTFDLGNAVSDLVREEWLGDAAIGNWQCVRCGSKVTMKPKPDATGCNDGKKHLWKYREVNFICQETGITGSIDVLVRLGGIKALVTELKIMAPDQFEQLAAPLAEHRIRTNLYLNLVDRSGSVWKNAIHTHEGRVLYVSRGYGKKHPLHGDILPFKEFTVPRDDVGLEKLKEMALAVKLFKDSGTMPKGICATSNDPIAKKCPLRTVCFSGMYPPAKP